jgi:hypothetical protein
LETGLTIKHFLVRRFFSNLFREENIIKIILLVSGFLFIIPFIIFLWKRTFFEWNSPIDAPLLGTLGDFIGGVLGSIWALAGVILFYLALKEQRKDFKTNEVALNKQIEALDVQIEEFGLQRQELALSRNVFTEQSKTLKKQQFESTFFSMIKMYSDNILALNSSIDQSEDYFIRISKELAENNQLGKDILDSHQRSLTAYNQLFYERKDEISHYFRIVYRIMRFIDSSIMNEDEKVFYTKILRSQFSEKELLILYYNSHTIFGQKFVPLILKYKLLKHLPNDSKLEFKNFKPNSIEEGFNRLIFNKDLITFIKEFSDTVLDKGNENNFPLTRSYENEEAGTIVHILSNNPDFTDITISLLEIHEEKLKNYLGLSIEDALEYLNCHFHHFFILSTYIDYKKLGFQITKELKKNEITYKIISSKKISI